MRIEFRGVDFPPLRNLTVSAPSGAVIGITGEKGSGKTALLRLAAGIEKPIAGEVSSTGTRRYLGPSDPLDLSPVDLLLMEQTLSQLDALDRAKAFIAIEELRSRGSTALVISHDTEVLLRLCDEVWWLDGGMLKGRSDPSEILDAYQEHIAGKLRGWADTVPNLLRLSQRRGDGRAQLLSIETLGEGGKATIAWRSGELVAIRVLVQFCAPVEDPVIGIMIRTRVGLHVYGTNTELEKVKIGECAAGDRVQLEFRFRCDLCPGDYTLTAASHDPGGAAHDWIDEAVAFVVTDSRYTAGVANLRATVTVERV